MSVQWQLNGHQNELSIRQLKNFESCRIIRMTKHMKFMTDDDDDDCARTR